MSVKDFYNSVTPGSSLTHGTGAMYVAIHDEDIGSKAIYDQERVPVRDSILNKVAFLRLFSLIIIILYL